MTTIESIDLNIQGSPSLVMKDLSEYATLAFLAAFDVQPQPNSPVPQAPQKRVTYIALSKKTMPMLVEFFMKFKESSEVYADGTLEAILSVCGLHRQMATPSLIPSLRRIRSQLSSSTTVPILLSSARTSRSGRRRHNVSSESSKKPHLESNRSERVSGSFRACFSTLTFPHNFQDLTNERVESIWWQMLDVFRGGILADW